MISIDLHSHTKYSHGKDTPAAMYAAARAKGIALFGFSEHSPRPLGYDYTHEYREHLTRSFPTYVREVLELQQCDPDGVLLGMEMDWMDAEENFVRKAVRAYDFDYLLGSVHFLKTWGYDDDPGDWKDLPTETYFRRYEEYFLTLANMARSGLFNIASHPDLIKIFSVDAFRRWLSEGSHTDMIRDALAAIRDAGMAMEISSAGLRKACREIYPGPVIMRLAADLGVPITFGSDAHNAGDVAYGFDRLEAYARSFGYTTSVWFRKGERYEQPF